MAPPPPPPPPPIHPPSSILSSSWRSSANNNGKARTSISPTAKSPVAWLDAETLQHAAANLRKTEHSRSVWLDSENLSNGRLDRKDQQLSGRYWSNSTLNESVDANQARKPIYASCDGPSDTVPISDFYRYTDSMSKENGEQRRQIHHPSSFLNNQYYSYYQRENESVENLGGSYIAEPQTYIRRYATQTPAYTVAYENYVNPSYVHYSNAKQHDSSDKALKFARELRDQGLTRTQRIANAFQESHIRSTVPPQTIESVYRVCQKRQLDNDHIDSLIRDMEWKMTLGIGAAGQNNCNKCGEAITSSRSGCTALDQTFHIACFTCKECDKPLAGGSFYNVDGKPLCEQDYKNTLERCSSCGEPIMDKLLRASGGTYHPACFVCTICKKCLDGIPFTVNSSNQIHCIECFHEKYAPRCAVCSKPIIPEDGEKESVRVVAMDKSFHVNCYRCEDCNLQLSSKLEGQGSLRFA